MYRRAWAIPDRVFDILVRFGPEVELDVIHAIRAYSKYWDEFETDEGFDYDFSYDAAMGIFYSVFDELKAYNQQYFERCQSNSENAVAGVKKRHTKSVTRKRQSRYYEKHREAINSKRRSDYAGKTKIKKASYENKKSVIRKALDESSQSELRQGVSKKSAIAHIGINGLNKHSSLHSESLLGKEGCRERGGSYPQLVVDKPPQPPPNNNRTSGLSCSKAVPPWCASPGGGSKGNNGSEAIGIAGNIGNRGSCGFGKAVNDSAKGMSAQSALVPNKRPRELLSAPHVPREGEVKITNDWVIDTDDEYFYPYRRMDPFLKRGVEDWLKNNKLGCSVEKRWICRLIGNFAKRQGKLKTLMGVDDDEE